MIDVERLKNIRRERNYKQYEVARLSSIAPSYYSEIEGGNRTPALDTTIAIAKVLGVTVNDILLDCDENPQSPPDHGRGNGGGDEESGLVRVRINVRNTLNGGIVLEAIDGSRKTGINTSVLLEGEKVAGIEISGYIGKDVSREAVGRLAREFEQAIGRVIDKLL